MGYRPERSALCTRRGLCLCPRSQAFKKQIPGYQRQPPRHPRRSAARRHCVAEIVVKGARTSLLAPGGSATPRDRKESWSRRHDGLGDAGLIEPQIMSSSARETPTAARVYVKRTELQRITAARNRRQFVERGS